jgi:hypothetical protein
VCPYFVVYIFSSGFNILLGAYTQDTHIGKGKAFSITGRIEQKLDSFTPGPGAYSTPTAVGGGSSPSFTLSGRTNTTVSSDSPGPGAYTHESYVGKAPAFSISGRTEVRLESSAPGLFNEKYV